MAGLTLFGYFPGRGWLYRIYPAVRLVFMAASALSLSFLPWIFSAVFIWILIVFYVTSEIPGQLIIPLFKFLIFMALVLMATASFKQGEFLPSLVEKFSLWIKLVTYTFLGLLFSTVTSASEIRGVFYRILKPFSFLPRREIVLVLTFVFTLLPLVFSLYRQVREAQELRGMGRMRNPFLRITKSLIPFLSLCFIRMDKMAEIYSVRCSGDEFVPETSPLHWSGTLVNLLMLALAAGSAVLHYSGLL